jgi:hypothetical protein
MALIHELSTCAICDESLDRPYTATSGVPFAADPRLAAYYDAPLHIDCLAGWAHREEFSRGEYVSSLANYWLGYGALLAVAPNWFLGCGPAEVGQFPYFAEVQLLAWPTSLYSDWRDWDAYVSGGFRELCGPEPDATEAVMAQVRSVVPTRDALEKLYAVRPAPLVDGHRSLVDFGKYLETLWGAAAHQTDWWLLEANARYFREALAESERLRSEAVAHSNEVASSWVRRVAIGASLQCPHCDRWTHELRFVDRSPHEKSFFVCQHCGRSFAGSE